MRLAYVCLDPGVPVFGRKGSSVHCQEVMRAFQRRGYQVELFVTRLGDDVPDDLRDIHAHQLAKKLSRDPEIRENALIDLNATIGNLLGDSSPFDLVYERYSLWSFSAMQFAEQRNVPGVLEVNAPLIAEQKKYRQLINERYAELIRDECFRSANSLIAVSEQVAARIRQNRFARPKTFAIPNGVNCEKFRGASTANAIDKTVIGFVGTLKPWHGVSILLDAFALAYPTNPKMCLKIVGAGPEEDNLKMHLSKYSREIQESVHWLGTIPNAEIPDVVSTFDIAVAPYPQLQDFYFSPLKVLEYMAAGRAIVASDIGQIPDLIIPGQTGVLVKPGCKNELAAALLQLSNDSKTRKHLGSSAQKLAREKHSWGSVVERILATVAKPQSLCGAT